MHNNVDDQVFINEARSWLGTKWVHGQHVKGAGVDCIQFPYEVYKASGLLPIDYKLPRYARDWAMHNKNSLIEEGLSDLFYKLPSKYDIQISDIVVFKTGMTTGHVGIYIGNNKIIHTELRTGVREDRLDLDESTVSSVWRMR